MGVQLTVNEARAGENFFLSGAELLEATVRYERPEPGGPDRTAGKGTGHLFEMDPAGQVVREWILGEETLYHRVSVAVTTCSVPQVAGSPKTNSPPCLDGRPLLGLARLNCENADQVRAAFDAGP